jgi:hypothetical protein
MNLMKMKKCANREGNTDETSQGSNEKMCGESGNEA